jgi:hypothetical protein
MKEPLSEDKVFIEKKEESEASFWRLKKAFDNWRENRVNAILAQEGESVWRTLGRPLFASGCILFDGPVMLEIVRLGDRAAWAWLTYFVALYFVIGIQKKTYDQIFSVDINQYSFDSDQ